MANALSLNGCCNSAPPACENGMLIRIPFAVKLDAAGNGLIHIDLECGYRANAFGLRSYVAPHECCANDDTCALDGEEILLTQILADGNATNQIINGKPNSAAGGAPTAVGMPISMFWTDRCTPCCFSDITCLDSTDGLNIAVSSIDSTRNAGCVVHGVIYACLTQDTGCT